MRMGPECWRLLWQLWGATGRESMRLRLQLWIAIVRWWLSELHVRICLARFCLAIYRREVRERRYETASMAVDYWKEKAGEESEW